ncbi:MAG: hypothetical protein M0R28_16175 [Pigmentiphaga sp.]|nr:hypothetical protein [Pigmentiphaga sp.]
MTAHNDPDYGRSGPIPGLLVSDGELLQQAHRLNRLLISTNDPAQRERFRTNCEALMAEYDLSDLEKQLLRDRDWQGMLELGASIYALAKGARAFGLGLLDVGAQMRGCSLQALRSSLPRHTLDDATQHG